VVNRNKVTRLPFESDEGKTMLTFDCAAVSSEVLYTARVIKDHH